MSSTRADQSIEISLARSLGFSEALTIGVGTMIGAGIFVLPGMIIARVGPGAVLSFAGGGLIALLVAMCAAEIATGMPRSGGGYYYISRALGPLWGALIGWGSWFGLIFASAFYAVGFGAYLTTVVPLGPTTLAVGMTAALVVLNLAGSRAAASVQNLVVAVLVVVLAAFVMIALPAADPARVSGGWAPFGVGAIWGGIALSFVSYCGFGAIASMAEEIKDPGRNLPRAIVGSVLLVTLTYCLVLLVCVLLRPWQQLTGPTLVADLAGERAGAPGRYAILAGAILATVSSANASIMSASRISFAMGRDALVGQWLNSVHPRTRVPHRAIGLTGALTLLVLAFGRIELLAEAAGLLHLVLYGLICVATIVLRGAGGEAYRPTFRVPLYPLVPLAGAAGCAAIIAAMSPLALQVGLAVLAAALAHYLLIGRRTTTLRGVWPQFLRRALLEPSLAFVERWGAAPTRLPVVLAAVGQPQLEGPRLRLLGALSGPRGELFVVRAFRVEAPGLPSAAQLWDYRAAVAAHQDRLDALRPLLRCQLRGQVPMTSSVPMALIAACEASQASLLALGWPGAGAGALLATVEQHRAANLLVLDERGPIPAARVLLLCQGDPADAFACEVAVRWAQAWGARLTACVLLPPGVAAERLTGAEQTLRATLAERLRPRVQTLVSADPLASLREAMREQELVVFAVPADGSLTELTRAVEPVDGCTLVLARGASDETSGGASDA